jgi:serine/threonine protein phosphatase PrpC
MNCETKGSAAVAWLKGTKHKFYEDRYRLLSREIPLVALQGRGELFAVFDGIGSAPKGMSAAQEMCDRLLSFYRSPERYHFSHKGIEALLHEANCTIHDWGFMQGTDRPLGGCAGTVAWVHENRVCLFHAGDTAAILVRDGDARQLTSVHEANGGIFRYFGLGEKLKIDMESLSLAEGDLLLLVSDGITKAFHPVEAARLAHTVFSETGSIAAAAKELVGRSRSKGSSDDITVLLIEIPDE